MLFSIINYLNSIEEVVKLDAYVKGGNKNKINGISSLFFLFELNAVLKN
jgi:hypothetical protein